MAHELAHVRNRDTLISTIVATLAGMISMIANGRPYSEVWGGVMIRSRRTVAGDWCRKHQSLPAATPATAHMFIVNPLKGGDWLASMFSTHPTTAQRAAKLQELAQRLGR
ncbi:MAG: hypothetical protein K0R55_2485 [Sporomusa sp.]|nr:hypothetical protein [Sporomusa sp.]